MENNSEDNAFNMKNPVVIVLSGKRKCGKDFIANKIEERFGHLNLCAIRISAPIKKQYAKDHNLDYNKLLSDSPYKEQHRKAMIDWSEEIRSKPQQTDYFIEMAIQDKKAFKFPCWLFPDIRRPSDISYLESSLNLQPIKILIQASMEVRESRGFKFTRNVDDAPSECGLDDYKNWDFILNNDGSEHSIEDLLSFIATKCKKHGLKPNNL